MCQTGSRPLRACPCQNSVISRPGSPPCMWTSTLPGAVLLAGTSVLPADHFIAEPVAVGFANLYLTPAPL